MQSVPITGVMNANSAHGEVYSIQYVIKFVSDLRQVSGFLRVLQFPHTINTYRQDIFKYCWKWRLTP
jgi:hypothetical protein